MKNRNGLAGLSAIIALLVMAGGLAFAAAQKRDAVSYHDTIVVLPGETRDSVVSFGGDIDVQGKVRKSVLSFGGTITISGEVGEAVVGFGARIVLKETAVPEELRQRDHRHELVAERERVATAAAKADAADQ